MHLEKPPQGLMVAWSDTSKHLHGELWNLSSMSYFFDALVCFLFR